jgi:hypothetical protein
MTKHIVQLPNLDGSLLLRELNHRINNELTSAICAVSVKAVQSDSVAVKAALLDVVDLCINAPMFIGRCTFLTKDASSMPRGTSSRFASP